MTVTYVSKSITNYQKKIAYFAEMNYEYQEIIFINQLINNKKHY